MLDRSIHLPKANVAHLPCILLPPSLPSLSPYFACSVPMQQHPYNGLACPADYSIFAWKWARSPWWHRNGLAHTVSMLAYGHRGRHDCAACLCADRWWHITESRTAWQTRWQHNVVAPGYAVHGLRVHNYENTHTQYWLWIRNICVTAHYWCGDFLHPKQWIPITWTMFLWTYIWLDVRAWNFQLKDWIWTCIRWPLWTVLGLVRCELGTQNWP